MKELQALTDLECSQWLGEKMFPWDETRCRICGWPLTPTLDEGCTAAVCRQVTDRPQKRADEHPNFVTTPWLTLDLMRSKSFVGVSQDEGVYEATFCGREFHNILCSEFYKSVNARLERAVVEAAMLAKGWKADG